MTARASHLAWFLLATLAMSSAQADACSCVRQTAESAFDRAKHVFVARIAKVAFVPPPKKDDDRWEPQLAGFTVRDTLKGTPNRVKRLSSGYGSGDCGVPLIVGADYLVLVGDHGRVSLCSGYFGPHFGLMEEWADDEDEPRPWRDFIESVRKHYADGSPIPPPPSTAFDLEDSGLLWFPHRD